MDAEDIKSLALAAPGAKPFHRFVQGFEVYIDHRRAPAMGNQVVARRERRGNIHNGSFRGHPALGSLPGQVTAKATQPRHYQQNDRAGG
jgi:hypothetical protein